VRVSGSREYMHALQKGRSMASKVASLAERMQMHGLDLLKRAQSHQQVSCLAWEAREEITGAIFWAPFACRSILVVGILVWL
jgi:hypothetical protein